MRILITRPEPEITRFAGQLAAHGIEAVPAPLLRIEPVLAAPPMPEGVQALVFTSANGVRAYAGLEPRRDPPVFAVGEVTAAAARAAGFVTVTSAEGDWQALAALLAEKLDPAAGPILHPAGEDRAGDLPGALAARGFNVVSVTVYRAMPVSELPLAARAAIAADEVDGVALFSPRSAGIFADRLESAGLAEKRGALGAFCLSAAVAEALGNKAAWRAVHIAERPNAEALLALIRAQDVVLQHGGPKDDAARDGPPPHGPPPSGPPQTGPPQTGPEDLKTMNDERAAYTGNDAERIVAAFGGIRPMAKALGIAVTTVQGWKERGAIPLKRMEEIRASAARNGIDLEVALATPAPPAPESAAPSPEAPRHEPPPYRPAEPVGSERVGAERLGAERVATGPAPGLRAAEAAPPPPPSFDAPPPGPPPGRMRWAFWGAGFGATFVAGLVVAMALGLGGRSSGDAERQSLDRLQSRLNAITSQLEEQQKRQQTEAATLLQRVNRIESAERAIGEQRERLASIAANAAAVASRLERLDMDMKALATRAPPGADAVKDLREQIEALAKRIETLPTEAQGAGTAEQLKQLAERLGAVERRANELAQARPGTEAEVKSALERQAADGKTALERVAAEARAASEKLAADSAQLRKDMAAIGSRVAALGDEVKRGVVDGAGPLVIAIGQLRRAVLDGTPYRPALDAVAGLAKDRAEMAPALEALRARAERGVATPGQLRARFDRVAVAALRAAATPGPEADFWDRVWSRMQSLVIVRRTGEVPGNTAAAQVSRAEAAVARGDLAEAATQLSGLTGPAREAASGWIADAKARLDADAALAKLDQAALGLLRTPEPKARP